MVWKSNLLGLGPEITQSFPPERCPRSFNEVSPRPSMQIKPKPEPQPIRRTGLRADPVPPPIAVSRSPQVQQPRPQTAPAPLSRVPETAISTPQLERDQLPPALVGMMDHIIGQVINATF